MVKLKNIFDLSFIIGIFYLSLSNSQSGRLTDKENEDRLKNCGKLHLERPSQDSSGRNIQDYRNQQYYGGLAFFAANVSGKYVNISVATMISSRHLITSFQVIASYAEYLNVQPNFTLFCEVPRKTYTMNLTGFNFIVIPCDHHKKCHPQKISDVRFFTIECDQNDKIGSLKRSMVPIVIEIADGDRSYPCLPEGKNVTGSFDAYGWSKMKGLMHRKLNYETGGFGYLVTNNFSEPGDRGGPLLSKVNGRWTLHGIGATQNTEKFPFTTFHEIMQYEQLICDWIGICPAAPVPIASTLKTTVTTPTTITPSTSTTTTTTTTQKLTTAKATTVTLPRSTVPSITATFNSTTLPFNRSIVTFPMSSIRPSTLITETPRRRKSKNQNPPVYYDTDDDDDRVEHEFDGKLFVEEDFFSGSRPTWGLVGSLIILLFLWF